MTMTTTFYFFQTNIADTVAGPAELWGKDAPRQSNVEPTIAKPNAVTTNTDNTTFLRQRLDERANSKIHEREILERFTDMNRRVDLADVNISKKFDANGMFPEQRDFYGYVYCARVSIASVCNDAIQPTSHKVRCTQGVK
jgi:hypothetical protein